MSDTLNRPDFMDEEPEILHADDLMRILGIGRNRVYRLLQSGEIRSKRVGIRYLISKGDVLDWFYADRAH